MRSVLKEFGRGRSREQGVTVLVNINILSAASLIQRAGLIYITMSYMKGRHADLLVYHDQTILKSCAFFSQQSSPFYLVD